MSGLPIGQMPPEEFDALIEDFVAQRSGQDDRLPGNVFFELLSRYERAEPLLSAGEAPVRVKGRVVEGKLVLIAPPGSPLQAEGNRVRWADGHEMIIELEPVVSTENTQEH
jgi:hypothetical protein